MFGGVRYCVVVSAAAFRPVGVDVYAFDDSRAAAIPPGRVESFKDFCESHGECVYSAGRGESAAWPVTWRRMTRRDRMKDNRSGIFAGLVGRLAHEAAGSHSE